MWGSIEQAIISLFPVGGSNLKSLLSGEVTYQQISAHHFCCSNMWHLDLKCKILVDERALPPLTVLRVRMKWIAQIFVKVL